MSSRSRIVVEDLGSKGGTWVNEEKVKGEKRVLSQQVNVLRMGSFPPNFRITWFPVVLSFSFTANQLRQDPLSKLRQDLEQLDIKFLADYDAQSTTHVVSKKRNTPKSLQALVNGRYIVTEDFYGTIIGATTPEEDGDGAATSALEKDFDANWPDAMQFVPPAGDEAVPRPVEAFAPNPRRVDIFHGYSFIFYNQKQYDNLLGPITTGRGKALLKEVVERETQIDDFIRYVKEVAGEKGLGEFEDGSEGKGVVVVRWIPNRPEEAEWFTNFYTSVSLRLDHRLIDQKEFLDAILNNDASGLRRPLETEADPQTSQAEQASLAEQQPMEVDGDEPEAQQQRPPPRRRARGAVKSRFRGFAVDIEEEDVAASTPVAPAPSMAEADESQGLFVSQDVASPEPEPEPEPEPARVTRKRPPPPESRDIMDDFAPTAAQFKRRRVAGDDTVPGARSPTEPSTTEPEKSKAKSPKVKKEVDILDLARKKREEAEARVKAEREELATAPEDIDLAEIRRLHIEEPMELRQMPSARTREQDIADGRWDPSWNGRKNFKKFRPRTGVQARQPTRVIVALQEVKSKGFGIGDDYWLENDDSQPRKKQNRTQSQSQSGTERDDRRPAKGHAKEPQKRSQRLPKGALPPIDSSEDEDEDMNEDEDEDVVIAPPPRPRSSRTSQQTSQPQATRATTQGTSQKTQPSRTAKRPAPPPAKEKPAKRSRLGFVAASDDESDDGLRFKFGKR